MVVSARSATLIEQARQATELDDFGDERFAEGLERLLWSLDNEANLTAQGSAMLDAQIVDLLSQRLQVEHWFSVHPEIDEQEIKAPLIGLGLPRTGSTAFYALLAEDPNVRFLRNWEASKPCPPPDAATRHSDPRIAETEAGMAIIDAIFPRLKSMLPASATGPTECQLLMGHDFKSLVFTASARIPSYTDWLLHETDLVPTYRYLKRVLKLLQWRCPPTKWRLKNPNHCLFIEAIDKVFPDARFWMTHRDVTKVLPSVCNVYEEFTKAYAQTVDRSWISAINIEWTDLGMRRIIDFRNTVSNDRRFFDAHFAEFQKDPFPTLERLYAFLGEELTPETRERMQRWRQETPREKHGIPDYEIDGFELDFDALRVRFQPYNDRFKIFEN